jgi:hypothetical protein
MHEQISRLLASNRTEEIGYDVWREYVLPPFFPNLTIGDTKKPRVIIGGRGCGKTMLLRYLSHESTFSRFRSPIGKEALSHIGLYWRSDTQFASLMQHRGVTDDVWENAFEHLAAVVLGIELLRSLDGIAWSSCGALSDQDIVSLNLGRLSAYRSDLPAGARELRKYLEDRLAEFESWANNVRAVSPPKFLPGHRFLKRLIALVREQLPQLESAIFFVYIDEYENLAEYQQRIVNTWLKHSEPPLIFNVAMKRNGFKTRSTDGSESLAAIHDYRPFDLEESEEFDRERDFPVFAAEILLLRLRLGGIDVPVISPDQLRDVAQLASRKEPTYTRNVQEALRSIFPAISQHEMASGVFGDATLKGRLIEKIEKALEKRREPPSRADEFLVEQFPEASIIIPALLHRDTLSIESVADEAAKLKAGVDNKFTGRTGWIHNNFAGCYLQIFDGLGRACPFYSGFEKFCYMARGNLRHFLELCHKALSRAERSDIDSGTVITVEMQAEAARQVSADFLSEVRSFGPQGNNLHTFVLRLGSLFSLSQQSPSQSESERTHFAIHGGEAEIDANALVFLSEAVKWSVLFEEKGTKKKNATEAEGIEYVLNPIYSPYFHISYRKRRKLDLSSADAQTIIAGEYKAVRKLLREFQERWAVDLAEAHLPLFAHLSEGIDE